MPKKKRIPWNKGKKCPWAQNNLQVFKKGHIPWSKGKKGICLNTVSDYPKLRFDISNGLILCEFCHRIYTNFGNQYNKIVKK